MIKVRKLVAGLSLTALTGLVAPYAGAASSATAAQGPTVVADGSVAIKTSGKTLKVPADYLSLTTAERDNGYWDPPPMPTKPMQLSPPNGLNLYTVPVNFADATIVYDYNSFIFLVFGTIVPAYAYEAHSRAITVGFTNAPYSKKYFDRVLIYLTFQIPGADNATATDPLPVPTGAKGVIRNETWATWETASPSTDSYT